MKDKDLNIEELESSHTLGGVSDGAVVIYCHLKKLSVGPTPRLRNLPSKS
jgi:hypothetical protein